MDLKCEVVVIGSGPGGAITAYTLAAAGHNVLLVEEGADESGSGIIDFTVDDMRRRYRDGGLTVALGRTPVTFAEACCLGGGSEINAGLYHRLPSEVIDYWRAKYKINGFTADDLHPHFEHCERAVSISRLPYDAPGASRKLKDGAERLGWHVIEVPRWFSYHEAHGEWRAVRQSMSRTFLPRARACGCRVLSKTRIERIDITGRRAYSTRGTTCSTDGVWHPLRIQCEAVFVCAGATGTPVVLRRSGITKHVGDTLAMHPTAKFVAAFEEEVNDRSEIGVHQVREFYPRYSFGCSVSSPAFLAAGLVGQPGVCVEDWITAWRRLAIYYVMTGGHNAGTVRAVPWSRSPLVRFHVRDNDLAVLAEGMGHLGRLLFAAGATTLVPSVIGWGPLRDQHALEVFARPLPARATSLMTIHVMGTCPMGEDESLCAVDSYGKVHRYDNIYVNDASLLPESPGVNPQGTIMAVARRNAIHYVEGRHA